MACGGRAMSTGAAITVVAVCAILRFAPGVPSRESRQARNIEVLLRTLAAVPPRYPRGQR